MHKTSTDLMKYINKILVQVLGFLSNLIKKNSYKFYLSFEMRRTRNETKNMVSYSNPDASSLSEVGIQLFLISHRKENVNFPSTGFKF